jgi:hypothetical protein
MADKWGQFDNDIPGGSALWDDPVVGPILEADYFAPTTFAGRVKMWTGTAWMVVRGWSGSQWVAVKAWTGTNWV